MPDDFRAELRLKAAFHATRPRFPLKLALTFADYPGVQTRAEVSPVADGAAPAGTVCGILLAQQFFAGRLEVGAVFTGSVAGEDVARGVLTEVVNPALRLPSDVVPASVNLHRYPADIAPRIDGDFGALAGLARQRLQVLLGERPDCRHPRIVRAILRLAGGTRDGLDEALDLARDDYRELLAAAERLGE